MSAPTESSRNDQSLEQTPVQSDEEQLVSRQLSLQSSRVPNTVAGYEILRCLGEGSFGMVWLARERKTGRQVAIKFFTNRRGLDWTLLTREVEKLAVLDASRDVVRLLDVGWDHDPPYFVMEYLPHNSVATLLEDGPLPIEKAVEITESVARALVHSHGAGILHCDIKPANILLDHGDEARLSDFGQSRLSSDQSPTLGTFYYMAPEQATLDAVPDVRWDVYALGAVLYHMLTGAPPYQSEEAQQRIANATVLSGRLEEYCKTIESSPFPNAHRYVPGIDGELIKLIDDCLNPIAALRIPNAQVVLDRLEQRRVNRSRKPLVWLGMIGPVLFLLMMLWIAGAAVPAAVRQAEQNLFDQALTSDAATVRLLAASVDQELLERKNELEELARELLLTDKRSAPVGDYDYTKDGFRGDLAEFLDQWQTKTADRLNKQRRTRDVSLFVNNRTGIQVYRNPRNDSMFKDFSYRDYFHGLGRQVELSHREGKTYAPRRTAGISSAFRSTVTEKYMVAIAVPIWDANYKNVIGVLARTIHITDLLSQWERRIRDGSARDSNPDRHDRFLSLVDMGGETPSLLDHYWMSVENFSEIDAADLQDNVDDRELEQLLKLTDQEQEMLELALADHKTIAAYQDPLADVDPSFQGQWLAAVADMNSVNWIAIVQERRSEAVAPIDELRNIFIRYGELMGVVFTAMLIILGWLIRRLSAA